MFATVLRRLKSPKNVGLIARSHVAFGGGPLVFLGYEEPWRFGPSTQGFSRGLEQRCEVVTLPDDDAFFLWCEQQNWTPVSIEIAAGSECSYDYGFTERTALVVGHEGTGLSEAFMSRCAGVVTIAQPGPVGSLNVAVACSVAMYAFNRKWSRRGRGIASGKFVGEHDP